MLKHRNSDVPGKQGLSYYFHEFGHIIYKLRFNMSYIIHQLGY